MRKKGYIHNFTACKKVKLCFLKKSRYFVSVGFESENKLLGTVRTVKRIKIEDGVQL